MTHFNRLWQHFIDDESGATAIEYGLLAALVALGIALGATALGTELGLFFWPDCNTIVYRHLSDDRIVSRLFEYLVRYVRCLTDGSSTLS